MESLPNRASDAGPDVPAEQKDHKMSRAAAERVRQFDNDFPPIGIYAAIGNGLYCRVGDGRKTKRLARLEKRRDRG